MRSGSWSLVLGMVLMAGGLRAESAVEIGGHKQLFIDGSLIARSEGVTLTMNKPVKDPEPVLEEADAVWSLYPAVLQEKDVIRLYYERNAAGKIRMAYAESKDGVHFVKPKLGLVEIDGSRENNFIFPLQDSPGYWLQMEGGGVFIDENPACQPEQKYKMAICYNGPDGKKEGTWVLASADGIRWQTMFDKPSFRYSDTGNVPWWDPRIGKYIAYVRLWKPEGSISPRVVCRCEFTDMADWGQDQVVLETDAQDPQKLVDLYTNAFTPYDGVYLMFPAVHGYKRDYLLAEKDQAGREKGRRYEGPWDGILAVSRDGVKWSRPDRTPFIPLGEYSAWDSAMISPASGLVRTESEVWLYYWGRNYPHVENGLIAGRAERCGIGRARLRLDGFVSADAAYTGGELTTVPVTFSGKKLEVNFASGVGGALRCEIQDADGKAVPGFSLAEADEQWGNFIRRGLTWKGAGDLGKLAGRPVRLRFVMSNTKLYAFQFGK